MIDEPPTETPNHSNSETFTAVYTSFRTLMNLVERMSEEGGTPDRLDRSYLSNLPGGAQSILMTSCRGLGLVADDGTPTSLFEQLVAASEDERKKIVEGILRRHYEGPLSLSARATQQQLEDEFRKLNVSGSTLRKAIGFFLNAAKFAEVPVSSNFKLPKANRGNARKRKDSDGSNGESGETQREPRGESANDVALAGLPTLVRGLIERLPADGEEWTAEESTQWLELAELTFPFAYKFSRKPAGGE